MPYIRTQEKNTSSTDRELLKLIGRTLIGTFLLCVGFANIYNLVGWAQEYNQVVVFFVYMSVAGMLFWGDSTSFLDIFRNGRVLISMTSEKRDNSFLEFLLAFVGVMAMGVVGLPIIS